MAYRRTARGEELDFKIQRAPHEIARARAALTGLVAARRSPRGQPSRPWNPRLELGASGRLELRDDLDPHSTFCGLEYQGRLGAVWRLTLVTARICPLAAYRPRVPDLPACLAAGSAEATHLMVNPGLIARGALRRLVCGACEWLRDEAKVAWLYTAAQEPLAAHLVEMGMTRAPAPAFILGPGDSKRSWLLFGEVDRVARALRQGLDEKPPAAE
jgi:hypothetical protein